MGKEATGVVVTGIGCVTPLGYNLAETWQNMLSGETGTRLLDEPIGEIRYAALIRERDKLLEEHFSQKTIRRYHESVLIGFIATREALRQAQALGGNGQLKRGINRERSLVIVGSGFGGGADLYSPLIRTDTGRVLTTAAIRVGIEQVSGFLSTEFDAKGLVVTPTAACASGAAAIDLSAELIRANSADLVITGGVDCLVVRNILDIYYAARALSTKQDDANFSSRPFDEDRDGFVMGEGAGILILESKDHAQKRGTPILAELVGFAGGSDAGHPTESSGKGANVAMRNALKMAGLTPKDISAVKAHATGTIKGDIVEVLNYLKIFGHLKELPFLHSLKGQLGHLLGAAGAVEAVLSIQSLNEGVLLPNRTLFKRLTVSDDEFKKFNLKDHNLERVNFVPRQPINWIGDYILAHSAGFGGSNVSLIFKHPNP